MFLLSLKKINRKYCINVLDLLARDFWTKKAANKDLKVLRKILCSFYYDFYDNLLTHGGIKPILNLDTYG